MVRTHRCYCCVPTCQNTSHTRPDLSFFTLPADKDRRLQWLQLIGRDDMLGLQTYFRYYTVCEDHFSLGCIRETNFRKLLTVNALPTLNLPLPQKNNERQASSHAATLDQSIQTEIHIEPSYSQKIILEHGSRAEFDTLTKIYARNELAELIKCDEKLTTSRLIVNHYESYKQFCLSLYYGSSQGYNLLKSAVRLPNLSTIYKHLQTTTTHINDQLIKALKMKVENMSATACQCIAVIDSMPLTPHLSYNDEIGRIEGFHEVNGIQAPFVAERALVMMIHGMYNKWQQPVGYALLSYIPTDDQLAKWINEITNKLCDLGLNIRILSFASTTEAVYFENRWMCIGAPYFCIKNNKRIYYISDPKMLLNALRNDLRLYEIHYDNNKVAKYEHIEQFYNKDKTSQYRLAPNLTDAHVYPTESDQKDAVELISLTVASALSAYIDCKQIDESAIDTAELVLKMSDLFALLNSTNNINCNERVFCDDGSHKKFLKEMKVFLQNLKLVDSKTNQDVTNTAKFVRGFLVNINSYLRLAEELKLGKYPQVPIRTLNQGLTEEFFRKIRLRSNATKPTALQFRIAFGQLVILKAIKPLKNCNTQGCQNNFFKRAKRTIVPQNTTALSKNIHKLKDVPHIISSLPNMDEIVIPDSDYNHIDRSERHTLIYFCGYLIKKCKEYHKNCEEFKIYVEGTSENFTLNHISRYLLYSHKNQLSLIAIPCNHFVVIIEKFEEVFRSMFKKNYMTCNIEQAVYAEIIRLEIGIPPCKCFPWDYLIKLFIRLRIAYTIHLNNREIGRNAKHFVIPLLLSETYTNYMA